MPNTKRGRFLIANAWSHYFLALIMLEQGSLRDAAGKAWEATKLATDALILERTGREPTRMPEISIEIRKLAQQNAESKSLRNRYVARMDKLHTGCFHNGICKPANTITRLILNTAGYIADAKRLADGRGS